MLVTKGLTFAYNAGGKEGGAFDLSLPAKETEMAQSYQLRYRTRVKRYERTKVYSSTCGKELRRAGISAEAAARCLKLEAPLQYQDAAEWRWLLIFSGRVLPSKSEVRRLAELLRVGESRLVWRQRYSKLTGGCSRVGRPIRLESVVE